MVDSSFFQNLIWKSIDRYLHTLQLLSAHVKVLLDAPEHLWRLIERKKYLSAAWLFLFTRVVHRALVQQDDQDEDSWSKVGIDVQLEFPLVQRQWDEVSSFRSQIIHKATLSLREIGLSAQVSTSSPRCSVSDLCQGRMRNLGHITSSGLPATERDLLCLANTAD